MIENLQQHYRKLLETHGDSPEAVQYSTKETQERRFAILADIDDLNGKSILDFGCGTGQLLTYLEERGISVNYTGVDIVDEFVELCRKKFPNSKFGNIDDFTNQQFDYVLIAGVFNNLMPDNREFYKRTLHQLFKMANCGISFNMMSAYVDYRDDQLFYEYPEQVFSFLKKEVTPYVTIRNDYEIKKGVVPFDFTVYAYRGAK